MGEWGIKKLNELGKIVNGSTPERNNPEFWKNGTIPWATPTDITDCKGRVINKTKERITIKGLKSCSTKLLPVGSILLTSRATIGEMKINSIEMCTNQGFKNIVVNDENHNWFVFYLLGFNKNKLNALGNGSTFKEVSKKDIGNLEFWIPLVKIEQSKIAEILTTIDDAVEKTEKIIAKYKHIKQGLMQDLLTKGIDEHGNIRSESTHKFKDSPLGRIPVEWEVKSCSSLIKLTSGKPKTRKQLENEKEFLYPVYGGNGVTGYSQMPLVNFPTLIIGRVGEYCGNTLFVDKPCWVTDNALYIYECDNNFNLKFYNYYFNYIGLGNFSSKTGQPLITQSIIKEIQVAIPSIYEQERITQIIEATEKVINEEIRYFNKLNSVKQGLMNDLLTGKVRVMHLLDKGGESGECHP
ncbi:restriction endonuclease subunit S [Thermincola ferriacetica]